MLEVKVELKNDNLSATLTNFIRSFVSLIQLNYSTFVVKNISTFVMKKHYILPFVSIFYFLVFDTFGQITTTPASAGNTVSICQNGSVVFSSTNNPPANATISWTFPGGSPASATTIGPHPVSYSAPGNYTATLTINGVSSNVNVNVAANTDAPDVVITPSLLQVGYVNLPNSSPPELVYCGNLAGPFNGPNVGFQFNITSYPSDHQILVNWGDGTSNTYVGNVGTITKSYDCTSQTIFTASFSVTGPSGCVSAGIYTITSAVAPQISVTGNANTHCMPEPYSFFVNTNNIPGTTVTFEFPGSTTSPIPLLLNNQGPTIVNYEFEENSCEKIAVITGSTFPNAYAGNLIGQNVCGQTFLSIGPIYVSNTPVANLTINPTVGYACVEEVVTITNTSVPGVMVSNAGCNELNKWCYTITPSTGWTPLPGSNLGDCSNSNWILWPDASMSPQVVFNEYGTYYIEITQANGCGFTTYMDSICIVAPIEADFTTNVLSGCTPLEINTLNTNYIPSCIDNDAVYTWTVSSIGAAPCPVPSELPNFLNNTNQNSFEPSFLFTTPGLYELQLSASLTNPIPGTLCAGDVQTVQINVSQGPNITFDSYSICQFDPIDLTNTVEECYATNTTFNWTLTGSTPNSSNDPVPTATYSNFGNFPVNVTVTNECGTANFSTSVAVQQLPVVTINAVSSACLNTNINLTAQIVGPAGPGQWTVSPAVGTINNPNSLSTSYTPELDFIGTLTFTFVTAGAPVECGEITATHTVIYDQDATVDVGPDLTVCQNGSIPISAVIGGSASSLTWSSNNAGASFGNVNDANTTFTPPAGFTGNITITGLTNDPPGVCQPGTDQLVINVVAPPSITSLNGTNQVCQGSTVPVSTTVSGNHTGVIWTSSQGTFNPDNTLSTNFELSPGFNGTATVTVTTVGGAPCPDASQSIDINVLPAPFVQSETLTICTGGNFNFTPLNQAPNTVPVGTQYTWTLENNANITGAAPSAVAQASISHTLNNISNPGSLQTQIYNVQPIATTGLNCPGVPFTLSVEVIPTPTFDSPGNLQFCSDENAIVNFQGVATNYNWTHTNTAIGNPALNATGSGDLNFQTAVAVGTLTSQFTVTPQYIQNNVTCTGTAGNFDIEVIPAPITNQLPDVIYCEGETAGPFNFVSPTLNSVFTWVHTMDDVGQPSASGNGNIAGFPAVNTTPVTTSTGTITATATFNGCVGIPMSFDISVTPTVAITNTQNSQTVCSGGTSNAVNWTSNATGGLTTNYSWSIVNTGATVSGFTTPGTGSLPSFGPLNIPGGSTTPGTLTVTVIPEVDGCEGTPFTYTITVNPLPIMSPIASQTICGGQAFTTPAFNSNIPGSTFSWSLQSPGLVPNTIGGHPTSGTGTLDGVVITNTGDLPYTLVYIITPEVGNCPGSPQTFSITINPAPTVQFSIGDQTICSNDNTQPVTLTSTTPDVNITWSMTVPSNTAGLLGPWNTTLDGGTLIPGYTNVQNLPPSNDPIIVTFTAIATTTGGNSCPGQPSDYTITINPNPTVAAIDNILVCNGQPVTVPAFVGTGNGYDYEVIGPNIGLIGGNGMSIPTFTATNISTAPQTVNVIVTPIFTGNNVGCPGSTTNFNIGVNPSGQINPISDTTYCNMANGAPINFTTNNTTGVTSYNWVNNGNAVGITSAQTNVTGISPYIANIGGSASVNVANIVVSPFFTSGGVTCSGPADTFLITVIPTPTVAPVSDMVFCNNIPVPQTIFTGTATDFLWTNGNTAIGLAATSGSGSLPGFTATNTDSSNVPISSVIEVLPIYETNGVICEGNSEFFTITVNTTAFANQVADIVVCNGQTINPITFSGVADSYSWSFSGPDIGLSPTMGDDFIPTFTATTGSTQSVVTVTVIPEYSVAGLVCFGTAMTFTITVNPTPTVNAIPNLTICSNFNQPQINFSGTGTTYEWITGPPVIGIPSPTGFDFIPAFTSENTPTNVTNTFTVTPIFTGAGLSCSGTSTSFGIQVLLNPTVAQLPDLEICNGECLDAIPFSGSGTNYVWSNNNTFIGVGPNGNGQAFPAFCGVNTNLLLQPIDAIISYFPRYTENNVSCNGDTLQFNITVNPTPSVTPINDLIVCANAQSPLVTLSGTASNYSWEVISNVALFGGLNPPNGTNVIPSFTALNNSDDQTNTGVIRITPEFDGSGLSCPGLPFDWNVIVNPVPTVDDVADQTLCFNTQSQQVVFTGTGTSYNWSVLAPPATVGSQNFGFNTFDVFTSTNTTNAPISNVFEVTPIFTTGNVSCPGVPTQFEIFVVPNPTVNQVAPASYCNNTLTNQVDYQGTHTSNTWVMSPANIAQSQLPSGSTFLPEFTGVNTVSNSSPVTATVTVTPFYTFNDSICQGADMSHTIAILPTTEVTQLPDLFFCNGEVQNQFPIQSTGNGISWNAAPNAGLTFGNDFFIPQFVATNLDTSPGAPSLVSTVTITPEYTDVLGLTCFGTPSSFDITVHPTPVIENIADYTVCNFGTVFQPLSTNVPSDITWSSSVNAFIQGNTTVTSTLNPINDGLTNTSPSPGVPQQTTYSVNAVSVPHGCPAETMDFVVNLMPTVVMLSENLTEICTGNQVGITFSSNVSSTYDWIGSFNEDITGISQSEQTSGFLSDILFNISNPPGLEIVNYIVTPTSIDGLCPGLPQTISVLVTPPPALISSPTLAICSEQVVNYNFVANTNANFVWYGQTNVNISGITSTATPGPMITDTLVNNSGMPHDAEYFVIITSTSAGNCSSQPIPITVTVNPLPQVQQQIKEICPNETVTFILEASEPSFFNWVATNNFEVTGETLVLTQSNFIQNTLTQSTYDPQYVYYNVTPTSNSTGCVGPTMQHIAIVNPLPNLSFTMSDILCTENPVTYTITPTTPLSVIWDLGNNIQSNIYNPTTYYDQPGQYVITLYGINPQTGCNDIVFVPVEILLAPEVDFITSSTQECVPAFFQFTNTANNAGSILQWNFGDSTVSNEQGVADHYYQEAGCYDVTLTATAPNGCPNSITYDDMVCAYNIPIAGFIVNEPIQYGDVNEFLFENLTVFGHTYFWDLGDGTTTNAVHPGHIYPINRDIYNVVLIATNEAGCSDTTMMSIQVKERLIFYVPNSFTPDGNTRNEIFQPVFTLGYDIYSYELMIFNRWGETMFESYNDKVGWDGTYGGKVMEDGTYVWRIRFRLLDDEDIQEYYGHVNLLK